MNTGAGTSKKHGNGRLSKRGPNTGLKNSVAKREEFRLLKQDELAADSPDPVSIQNYKFIASYNWTKDNNPTILVPGTPARWNPPTLPFTIEKDDGNKRKEENQDRVVVSRWAPLFATLHTAQPTYSLAPVSLVIERNSLRKLFDFAAGIYGIEWRMEVALVHDTLFITRWERDPSVYLNGSFFSGYGHSFENAVLSFDDEVEESLAHHRIVEYEIGGMKWVVRFEADGYIHEGASEDVLADDFTTDIEQLSGDMSAVSLSAETEVQISEGIKVIKKGNIVPPTSVLEAKCSRNFHLAKCTPQCWFSQTKHIFRGHEVNGTIPQITHFKMERSFSTWESGHQVDLKKLMNLIIKIKDVAKETKHGKCFIGYNNREKPKVLRFFGTGGGGGLKLSDEVKERHWGSPASSA